MAQKMYTPEYKAKIVLEVLQGERELGEIAGENSLNPNMVRNWKKEFLENARGICGPEERRTSCKEGRKGVEKAEQWQYKLIH